MQVLRFGICFNYKMENQRAFLYLMIPWLYDIFLSVPTFFYFSEPESRTALDFLILIGPTFFRAFINTSISWSFVIFIRSSYIRFAALNSLIRSDCCFIDFTLLFSLLIPISKHQLGRIAPCLHYSDELERVQKRESAD